MATITTKKARQLGWLPPEKKKKAGVKIPKSKPKAIAQMEMVFSHLKSRGIIFVAEYQFAPPRKFRFDFCCHRYKIACEYEGIFSDKSRHTSFKGYSRDGEKYNLAAINGWKVLRYTAMNYTNMLRDIELIIANDKQRQ